MSQTQPTLDPKLSNYQQIPPVRKTVRVTLSPDAAFRRFTEQISDWWPLPDYSVGQENSSHVVFGTAVGEYVVEHFKDGSTTIWGRILVWEPGRRVVFTWHPGRDEHEEERVSVTFDADGDTTRVELVHVGWEAYGAKAQETRDAYNGGWKVVMARFVPEP